MTTSAELNDYMIRHKGEILGGLIWRGVFPSDRLPTYSLEDLLRGFCCIFNYDPSSKSGSHWVALRVEPSKSKQLGDRLVTWFDSYGENADMDNGILSDNAKFKQYIAGIPHREYKYNIYDFQSIGSDVCGLYSVYFCLNGLPDDSNKWDLFHKSPKAIIQGKTVRLHNTLSKENDELIQKLVPIKLEGEIIPQSSNLVGEGIGSKSLKSYLHSVVFHKNKFTTKTAENWLKEHNYKPIKHVDITENTYRYRIREPELFQAFTTEVLPNGINLVLGWTNKKID